MFLTAKPTLSDPILCFDMESLTEHGVQQAIWFSFWASVPVSALVPQLWGSEVPLG